ncbi:glycoside hydrolase family 88 protein [Myxococcus sp. RHSTA-1-4]|uniref:glycoside hydrolase family 88 protein n=1 Tax=Myxococcus sp. RHSTA-1-4 TaxID=2874601 RepID=UPI001CBC97D5|nr:glycoside hydrolase family 88 protein [Myxococcus sp. RHSTA-1-4]
MIRLLGISCLLLAGSAQAFDDATANRVLLFARQQALRTDAAVPQGSYPQSTQNGTWRTFAAGHLTGWTQGFFPGELWYLAEDSGDANLRSKADTRTRPLEVQKTNSTTHDTGFKLMTSFGNAYRMTGNEAQRQVLLTGAGSLARRYNSELGYVVCCDWNRPTWLAPLVVDTMMDIELLLWGAAHGGQAAWKDMAISHALKTRDLLVRADGSSYHVVDFDPNTGAMRLRGTYQGAGDETTWARGQTWLMYGYTMAYRYTRDARMLAVAEKTSDWYVNHLPADSVPLWDFNAPPDKQYKDTSAAAIAASALLELSGYTADPARKQRYQEVALRTLDALSSPAYLVASGTPKTSVLQHGVGNAPAKQEIDVGLIYGDYYFVEAMLRFKRQARFATGWGARRDFTASVHTLGTGNTGVVSVEFDVTPRRYPLDDVIGYAGSATPITGFSSAAMQIRMNPNGRFDVRNGGAYAALAAVPYSPDTTYHLRMVADLNTKRYSVWVRPPGGAEVQLASNYAFRSDAPVPAELGKVSLVSTVADDAYTVSNHSVKGGQEEVWASRVDFGASVHSLGTGNTGVRTVEFDVTPARNLFDGVIGYADTSTNVTSFSSSAMLIRMNTNGRFDVRNGGAYAALTAVPYSAGNTYHVRMVTDLNTKRYSVWVRPPGGAEIQIASNYAFRSDAPPTDDLGKISVSGTTGNDTYTVAHHTVRAGTLAVPPRARRAPSDR